MKTDLFFVYGTLKVGGRFARMFNDSRINSTRAEVVGYALFDLGTFPGIRPGEGKVIGELHEYKDPEKVTRAMDQIEGYNPNTEDGMYVRKRISVKTETGEIKKANIYIFNREISNHCRKIESGIWEFSKK